MWISPPMVVLVTSPRIQRMTRTMATVINIKLEERGLEREGDAGVRRVAAPRQGC
jgi:hypothetical protein